MIPSAVPFKADIQRQSLDGGPIFETEDEAKAHLVALLTGQFWLLPEVWMAHYSGKALRMDYLAIPRPELSISIPFPAAFVGIEVKQGYKEDFRRFTDALRQCHDYQESTIVDKRTVKTTGQRPPFVLLYPPIVRNGHELLTSEAWREGGALRMAGKLKVGVIRELWSRYTGQSYLRFEVSGSPIWDSRYGPRGDAERFGTAHKVGSS